MKRGSRRGKKRARSQTDVVDLTSDSDQEYQVQSDVSIIDLASSTDEEFLDDVNDNIFDSITSQETESIEDIDDLLPEAASPKTGHVDILDDLDEDFELSLQGQQGIEREYIADRHVDQYARLDETV